MAVTAENARLNLRTVARNVADRLGVDPADMDATQRIAFNQDLAAEILKYPQSFTPEILAIAEGKRFAIAEQDDSIDWGQFTTEVASNAVPVLSGFTDKLLLILALGVAVWAAVHAFRYTPSPSAE